MTDKRYKERPYTEMRALGISGLEYIGFDSRVLTKYADDPRYDFSSSNYAGSIYARDKFYAELLNGEEGTLSIQTFAHGEAENGERCVLVMLHYLSELCPSSQLYWRSYERKDKVRLLPQAKLSLLGGHYPPHMSALRAIPLEMRIINELCGMKGLGNLFKDIPDDDQTPVGLSMLHSPTYKDFMGFVIALHALTIDSIDKKFFPQSILRTKHANKNGGQIERFKGSLELLEEWLRSVELEIGGGNESKANKIVKSLRDSREPRGKMAHSLEPNKIDYSYYDQQVEILQLVYHSLADMRELLCHSLESGHLEIPKVLLTRSVNFP